MALTSSQSRANKAKGDAHETLGKGLMGEARWLAYASSMDWHLYRGMNGHEPCDYVVDMGGGDLARIEIKYVGALQAVHKNYYYMTVTKLHSKNFDYLFVATPQGDYLIPASHSPSMTLSIKAQRGREDYERNITRPGKYERFRVTPQSRIESPGGQL